MVTIEEKEEVKVGSPSSEGCDYYAELFSEDYGTKSAFFACDENAILYYKNKYKTDLQAVIKDGHKIEAIWVAES